MRGFRYISSVILLSAFMPVEAQRFFLTTSKGDVDHSTGNYLYCPNWDILKLMPEWHGETEEPKVAMKWYVIDGETPTTDFSNPIKEREKVYMTQSQYRLAPEEMEFLELKHNVTKTFTLEVTYDSGEKEYSSITITAKYLDPPTEIPSISFCEGAGMGALTAMAGYTDTDKYSWYDSNDEALKGFTDMVAVGNQPEGEYVYYVRRRDKACRSEKAEVIVKVRGKQPPVPNVPVVIYSSDEDYQRDVQEQSLALYGSKLLDEDGCKYTWYDPDGKKLDKPYTPPKLSSTGTATYTPSVSQNCGCGESKPTQFLVITASLPYPRAENKTLCCDKTKTTPISITHKATINLLNDSEQKSHYKLQVSDDKMFASFVETGFGEETFNITVDVSQKGEHTFYVRQVSEDEQISEASSFIVKVAEPDAPKLSASSEKVCANTPKTIDLSSYISSQDNSIATEWYDNGALLSENIFSISSAETKTFQAKNYILLDNEKCYSSSEELSIQSATLDFSISGESSLCAGSIATISAEINSSEKYTIQWSSDSKDAIKSPATNETISVGSNAGGDIMLKLEVSNGICTGEKNLTIAEAKGSLVGNITLKRADGGFVQKELSEKLQFYSCDLDANIELDLQHSSAELKVITPSGKEITRELSNEILIFQPTEWGSYKFIYQNTCLTSFEVSLLKPEIPTASLLKSEDYFCKNEVGKVNLNSYTIGSTVASWFTEDNEPINEPISLDDETKNTYTYLYVPFTDLTNDDATISRCYGKGIKFVLHLDTLAASIDAVSSLCPDEKITLKSVVSGTSPDAISYSWSVTPESGLTSASTEKNIEIKGIGETMTATLTVSQNACERKISHTLKVGRGVAKGKLAITRNGKAMKQVNAGEEILEIAYCGGQMLNLDLLHTEDYYVLSTSNGKNFQFKFSSGPVDLTEIADYTLTYTNECETILKFKTTSQKKPKLEKTKISLCPNDEQQVMVVNAEGCKVRFQDEDVWREDGKLVCRADAEGKLQTKSYEVECDGCPITVSDNIEITTKSSIALGSNLYAELSDSTICLGEEVRVLNLYSEPTTSFTVQWENSADIKGDLNSPNVSIKPNITDWSVGENYREVKYLAVLSSETECMEAGERYVGNDTVKIRVGRPFSLSVDYPSVICFGENPTLSVRGVNGEATYLWNSRDDENVDGQTTSEVTAMPNEGNNEYMITVEREGCKASKSFQINSGAIPSIIEVQQSTKGEITIAAESLTGKALEYLVGGKTYTNGELGKLPSGEHKITIREIDGCAKDTVIVIEEQKLFIPSYFTPNGDGENDIISIPKEFLAYENTVMYIFTRTGKKIAVLDNASPDWDGTYNGENMPSDDYWYTLYIDAIRKYYSGHFTLIRK